MNFISERIRIHKAGVNAQNKDELDRLNSKQYLTDKEEKRRKQLIGKTARADKADEIQKEKNQKPVIKNITKTKIDKSAHHTEVSNTDNSSRQYGVNGNTIVTETNKVNEQPKQLPPKNTSTKKKPPENKQQPPKKK